MSRIDQLQQMLEEDPHDVFLYYALGMEFLNSDVSKAVIQFEKVLQMDASYVAAYYQLGQVWLQQNNPTKALVFLKQGRQEALKQNNRKAAGEFEEAIFLAED
jgi:tetratricopeptide (TPR) repeat protein